MPISCTVNTFFEIFKEVFPTVLARANILCLNKAKDRLYIMCGDPCTGHA